MDLMRPRKLLSVDSVLLQELASCCSELHEFSIHEETFQPAFVASCA